MESRQPALPWVVEWSCQLDKGVIAVQTSACAFQRELSCVGLRKPQRCACLLSLQGKGLRKPQRCGKGKGKKKGKRGKVTAEMKRAARKAREAEREEKAAGQQREREEIFEVGDEGMSLIQLADMIQEDPSDIVRTLFMKGIMLSMNQVRAAIMRASMLRSFFR
eukprot:1156835-Pelagomonas_calceolata.AAC.2